MSDETKLETTDGDVIEEGSEESPIELFDLENAEEPDITIIEDGEIVSFDDEDEESEEPEEEVEESDEAEDEESEVDEEESEEPEATEAEGEESAPESEDEDSDEESPTEPAVEAATETPADGTEPTVESEPLTFKADGTEFTVDARKDDEGNFVIAPEEWQRSVQPRLADRGRWQAERESLRRQIAALNPETNPEVVRAREVTKRFHELLEQGPDAVIEWAENWEANKDALLARAEAEAAKAEAARYREEQDGAKREEQTAELEGQLDAGLDRVLEQASQHDQYADLDMDYVKRILAPMKASIFFRAPYDMPEYGLKEGEIGMNTRRVEEVLQAEASRQAALNEKTRNAKAAEDAAKRNAAATGKAKKTSKAATPPVEKTSSVSPTQEGEPEIKPAKNKEEWEDNLRRLVR